MLDENIDILALETVQFAIHQSQVTTVAVSTDGAERTEVGQLFSHFRHAVDHGGEHGKRRLVGGQHLEIGSFVAADVGQFAFVHGSLDFVDVPAFVFLGGGGDGVKRADGIDE